MSDIASSLSGWNHVEAKGRRKIHGLVVLFRDTWKLKGTRTVYLDEEELHHSGQEGSQGNWFSQNGQDHGQEQDVEDLRASGNESGSTGRIRDPVKIGGRGEEGVGRRRISV